MIHRLKVVSAVGLGTALLFTACGRATVKTKDVAEDFALESLRSGTTAVIVDAEVGLSELTESYLNAFTERFGSSDSLSAYLSARLLDSLNYGVPSIRSVAAPALNPRHILHVRNLHLARVTREVPTALLPSGSQQSMQSAGGGTSEGWTVSFEVDVWRPTGVFWNGDSAAGSRGEDVELVVPDSATGLREYSFSVTGQADVPLYAYKSALVEAVNAAITQTAKHLRGKSRNPTE